MNYDGFYLIDKPKDWTSFDVCARMRKILNTRKIGHTGTLDPFATGLLIVAVGKATRLIPFLEKAKKTYVTKIILGQTSETLDPESEIVKCEPSSDRDTPWSVSTEWTIPSEEDVKKLLDTKFQGPIEQIPPQYSAIKMNGKKACDMARKGEKVEMKSRQTEIFETKILDYNFPEIEIELTVAAGFYVRSFARDLGTELAGGGMCQELRRTKIEDISVEEAEPVDMITGPIDPKFILTNVPQREIPTGRVQDFIAGRAFPFSGIEGEKILVLVGGKSIGVGEMICRKLQPRAVL
ncbi:tRNA pseudouridine(55) synthase TruB [Candidatus Gracilibacteria bacterium]|nr:tRNA pseudouridine(55) synthase TruB [Candidatus Gracilibacteria bacterium]